MLIGEATAPTFKELRPFKEPISGTFPVYPRLVATLADAGAHPNPTVAHVLGTCAGYSYADENTVATILARMGLEEARCRTVSETVDAMFIRSTAFVVQSRCGRVVLVSYRGTEPANFISWLTDADVNPETVPFDFQGRSRSFAVHAGFYRNVRATRFEVLRTLELALNGQSILEKKPGRVDFPLQALYVTGHSLGAAMAAIFGVMLATDPAYADLGKKLRAVYTFGQPMIGSPEFAAACNKDPFLSRNVLRYVFGRDVVASLPPAASGPFAHFGPEYAAKKGGAFAPAAEPCRQVPHLLMLAEAPLAFLARQVQLLRNVAFQYSLDDHGPQHYIAALTPPDVMSEYGA